MKAETREMVLEALDMMLGLAESDKWRMARPARREAYPEEYDFAAAEVELIKAAIADLRAEPTLEVVPDGEYIAPGYNYPITLDTKHCSITVPGDRINYHPDWRIMRRVDDNTGADL